MIIDDVRATARGGQAATDNVLVGICCRIGETHLCYLPRQNKYGHDEPRTDTGRGGRPRIQNILSGRTKRAREYRLIVADDHHTDFIGNLSDPPFCKFATRCYIFSRFALRCGSYDTVHMDKYLSQNGRMCFFFGLKEKDGFPLTFRHPPRVVSLALVCLYSHVCPCACVSLCFHTCSFGILYLFIPPSHLFFVFFFRIDNQESTMNCNKY